MRCLQAPQCAGLPALNGAALSRAACWLLAERCVPTTVCRVVKIACPHITPVPSRPPRRLTLLPFTLWDTCHWGMLPVTGLVAFLLLGEPPGHRKPTPGVGAALHGQQEAWPAAAPLCPSPGSQPARFCPVVLPPLVSLRSSRCWWLLSS